MYKCICMLTAVLHFKSIWKVYCVDMNGCVGLPKCSSFQAVWEQRWFKSFLNTHFSFPRKGLLHWKMWHDLFRVVWANWSTREFLNTSKAKLKQIMTTFPRGCWCLPQKYFKTKNINCFELEVTAAKRCWEI